MAASVLAVAQAAELGGAEGGLLRIARRLPERGFDVTLTVPGRGGLEDAARAAGIEVHTLPVGGLGPGQWPRALTGWPHARRLAKNLHPDLVYLNGTVAQRLAPMFDGLKQVIHLHDMVDAAPRPWRSRRFWRWVPLVLCDSDAVRASAEDAGVPGELLRTVHCPVDPIEAAARPEWWDGSPVIGYVGRIEPRKGVIDLMTAAESVFERVPDARLVVVGADDFGASRNYARKVRRAAEQLGDRVLLLGRMERADTLMPWFDVLCVPSRTEPFGTVAAEALSVGTAVVATRSGGMSEYVVPGVNGALVDPGEPALLADAIVEVLAEASGMKDAARAAAAPFASELVADVVAKALHEALDVGA